MKLDLSDLRPEEAEFELGGKKLTLRKFSLAVQILVQKRFTNEELTDIFDNRKLPALSEIAFLMLKTSPFPSLDDFQDAIVTQADRVAVVGAIIKSIGVAQPLRKAIEKETPPLGEALAPSIGAESMTSSPQSTATASTNS